MPPVKENNAANTNLRKVMVSDKRRLFELKNDPIAIKFSISQKAVTWQQHTKWFDKHLKDPKSHIYVLETICTSEIIGVIRFNCSFDFCKISIVIDNNFRGKGLATECLQSSLEALSRESCKPAYILAEVLRQNTKSIRLFEKCGFQLYHQNGNLLTFRLNIFGRVEKG